MHVAKLPELSVTVHLTTVTPTGNTFEEEWSLVTEAIAQLSLVAGVVKLIVALHTPKSLFTLTSALQIIVGNSLSFTITF